MAGWGAALPDGVPVDERLESVEMAALASAAPADDDVSAESPQDAAPADNGSVQPPEHRCTVSSTASLPLVSLSVRFTESALGSSIRAPCAVDFPGRACRARRARAFCQLAQRDVAAIVLVEEGLHTYVNPSQREDCEDEIDEGRPQIL